MPRLALQTASVPAVADADSHKPLAPMPDGKVPVRRVKEKVSGSRGFSGLAGMLVDMKDQSGLDEVA